jgi:hypothetical protein
LEHFSVSEALLQVFSFYFCQELERSFYSGVLFPEFLFSFYFEQFERNCTGISPEKTARVESIRGLLHFSKASRYSQSICGQ